MVRLKKVLDNDNSRLEYSMQCFDYGFTTAQEDQRTGLVVDFENFPDFMNARSAERSHVIQHWADLTDEGTSQEAATLYAEAFQAGYTEFVRGLSSISKSLGPYTNRQVRLFVDPWTTSWGYTIVSNTVNGEYETEPTCGFPVMLDAYGHARRHYSYSEYSDGDGSSDK